MEEKGGGQEECEGGCGIFNVSCTNPKDTPVLLQKLKLGVAES